MIAYVVESPVTRADGVRAGTTRVYVRTEDRARELSAQHPERSWRAVDSEEMPADARANMFGR